MGGVSVKALECFISQAVLVKDELITRKQLNTFAVVFLKSPKNADYDEIARTETCTDNSAPSFCTSFEVQYNHDASKATSLRIEIYSRLKEGVERLLDNEIIGTSTFSLHNLITALDYKLEVPILEAGHTSENIGFFQIISEPVTSSKELGEIVEFDFSSSLLRKREWPNKFIPQYFALYRSHLKTDDEESTTWIQVYRSDRVSKVIDNTSQIDFSTFTLTKRHLCNGDEERPLKLSLYGSLGASSPKKSSAARHVMELGYIEISLREICEIDPTKDTFALESTSIPDEDIGSLVIVTAEPTDVGSHFALKFQLLSTSSFLSADCNNQQGMLPSSAFRGPRKHIHRLQRKIATKKNEDQGSGDAQEQDNVQPSPLHQRSDRKMSLANAPEVSKKASQKRISAPYKAETPAQEYAATPSPNALGQGSKMGKHKCVLDSLSSVEVESNCTKTPFADSVEVENRKRKSSQRLTGSKDKKEEKRRLSLSNAPELDSAVAKPRASLSERPVVVLDSQQLAAIPKFRAITLDAQALSNCPQNIDEFISNRKCRSNENSRKAVVVPVRANSELPQKNPEVQANSCARLDNETVATNSIKVRSADDLQTTRDHIQPECCSLQCDSNILEMLSVDRTPSAEAPRQPSAMKWSGISRADVS